MPLENKEKILKTKEKTDEDYFNSFTFQPLISKNTNLILS